MFLLGAGASMHAGVPVANEMTKKIIESFDTDSPEYRVLTFVVGGLLFKEGQAGRNPTAGGVNVEDLFNAVQFLAGRHQLEASPFVGSGIPVRWIMARNGRPTRSKNWGVSGQWNQPRNLSSRLG